MRYNLKSSFPKAILPLLSALLLSSLACSLSGIIGAAPTPTPSPAAAPPTLPPYAGDTPSPTEPAAPPTPAGESVSFRGASFSYDPALAGFVNVEVVEAVEPDDNPVWLVEPEHLAFTFVDYVLAGTFHEPAIYVYPVAEFEAVNEGAAEAIDGLRGLLAERPADPQRPIPFLPVFNAGQFFAAGVEYLNFQSGSGVRFLTQYGQAVSPVNNQDLFYTFQGMTADGAYYVAAVLPVSHPSLPATADAGMAGQDPAEFAEAYQAYLQGVEEDLNAQDPASFYPSLLRLDDLVRSVQVE